MAISYASDEATGFTRTQTRILDSAEHLFAERGYRSTSVREITSEAGVNLGAIHYHFRGKEALLRAVVTRRSIGINRERLEMLARVEPIAPGQQIDPEAIFEAFLAPVFRMACEGGEGGRRYARLMARLYLEEEPLPTILNSNCDPVWQTFTRALKQTLPARSEHDLAWLVHFALGAFAYTLRSVYPLGFRPNDDTSADDWKYTLQQLVSFLSGGFGFSRRETAADFHNCRDTNGGRPSDSATYSTPSTNAATPS